MNNIYAEDADRLSKQIFAKRINTSIWHKLPNRIPWVDGMSVSQRVLTMERNLPDDVDTWTEIGTNANATYGGNCVPTPTTVQTGSTERSFKLYEKALKSLPICVKDIRNAFEAQQQSEASYNNLVRAVDYVWKRHNMARYYELSEHKVIAAPGLPESSSHFPNTPAQWILNNKILKRFYQDLISDGAEYDGGSLGSADGRPQLVLSCSAETSDALFAEAGVNAAMISGASNRVPEVLAALGVERPLFGFYHTIEKLPRRWNYTAGQWVEVQPYVKVAATNGYKDDINPLWKTAPFEDSIIYLPSVMDLAVPGTISTAGGGTSFGPNPMGKFTWLNIQHPTDNPVNSWGFYYCEIECGAKPVHPEFGIVIRHLRCFDDLGGQGCPADDGSVTSSVSWDLADSTDVEYNA
jgi:hypothetical protein